MIATFAAEMTTAAGKVPADKRGALLDASAMLMAALRPKAPAVSMAAATMIHQRRSRAVPGRKRGRPPGRAKTVPAAAAPTKPAAPEHATVG